MSHKLIVGYRGPKCPGFVIVLGSSSQETKYSCAASLVQRQYQIKTKSALCDFLQNLLMYRLPGLSPALDSIWESFQEVWAIEEHLIKNITAFFSR